MCGALTGISSGEIQKERALNFDKCQAFLARSFPKTLTVLRRDEGNHSGLAVGQPLIKEAVKKDSVKSPTLCLNAKGRFELSN